MESRSQNDNKTENGLENLSFEGGQRAGCFLAILHIFAPRTVPDPQRSTFPVLTTTYCSKPPQEVQPLSGMGKAARWCPQHLTGVSSPVSIWPKPGLEGGKCSAPLHELCTHIATCSTVFLGIFQHARYAEVLHFTMLDTSITRRSL